MQLLRVCLLTVGAVFLLPLCGCHSSGSTPTTPSVSKPAASGQKAADIGIQDNALNLLRDLLGDEKNVSKVMIVKAASPEVKQLIKDISQTARTSLKVLDSFAKSTEGPPAEHLGLPPGEVAVREAIAKTKKHELLHTSGSEFEFQLLLTQADALNYGTHLARVAAENESDPSRGQKLEAISQELNQLHEQVLAHLRSLRTNAPP